VLREGAMYTPLGPFDPQVSFELPPVIPGVARVPRDNQKEITQTMREVVKSNVKPDKLWRLLSLSYPCEKP